MGLVLEVRTVNGGETETYSFSEFPVHVGRDATSELRLPYPFVSRHHARIERTELGLALIDEGSRNGTVYRGTKIKPKEPVYLSDEAEFVIDRLVGIIHIRDLTELTAFQEATAHDRATSLYADQLIVPEVVSRVALVMEQYRAAHDAVVDVVAGSLGARPEWHRTLMAERLATEYPELALDPGLQKVLAERGVHLSPLPASPGNAGDSPRIFRPLAATSREQAQPRTALPGVDSLLDGLDESKRVGFASELAARVEGVLGELSPEEIERGACGSGWPGLFRTKALWREFARRHERVAAAFSPRHEKPGFVEGPALVGSPSIRGQRDRSTANACDVQAPDAMREDPIALPSLADPGLQ